MNPAKILFPFLFAVAACGGAVDPEGDSGAPFTIPPESTELPVVPAPDAGSDAAPSCGWTCYVQAQGVQWADTCTPMQFGSCADTEARCGGPCLIQDGDAGH